MDLQSLLAASFNESRKKVDLMALFEQRLEEYSLTQSQALNLLGLDRKSAIPILTGEAKHPNLNTVLKLAQFLDVNLDVMVRSVVANQSPDNIQQLQSANWATFITKNFDVDRLLREGFINSKLNTEFIVQRLLDFFGFSSLHELEHYQKNLGSILYSQPDKKTFVDKMRDFAIKSAFRTFELINNPNEYNREKVKQLIPKIKPYCRDIENGLYIVCRALYQHGVTVIFQRHLTTSQYRGATFIVNQKPCIVLTDLYKAYPTLWFALLHELYHVLFDMETLKQTVYHLSGHSQSELFLEVNEEAANEFAREFFFGEDMYNYIRPVIHNPYLVDSFAKTNNIHKSFVYRGFQYFAEKLEGLNYWGAFGEHLPDISLATKKLAMIAWSDSTTLPKAAESFKKMFEITNTENEKRK